MVEHLTFNQVVRGSSPRCLIFTANTSVCSFTNKSGLFHSEYFPKEYKQLIVVEFLYRICYTTIKRLIQYNMMQLNQIGKRIDKYSGIKFRRQI